MQRWGIIKFTVKKRVWLEFNGKPILGKGRYQLLKGIDSMGSIKKSAKEMGICEKTAHKYIRNMESRLKNKIISSQRGGRNGGGNASLTKTGKLLLAEFERSQ